MVKVTWLATDTPEAKCRILVTKENNETITLCVGDFITYTGRPDGVRVEEFTGSLDKEGPIGMTYLPWRKQEQKWATFAWSLRGNIRHIIAYPSGIEHYGEHIDWESVEFMNNGICPYPTALNFSLIHSAPDVPHLDALQAQQ